MQRMLGSVVVCGVAVATGCQPAAVDITVPLLAQGATWTAPLPVEDWDSTVLTPRGEGIVDSIDVVADDEGGSFSNLTLRAVGAGRTVVEVTGAVEGEFDVEVRQPTNVEPAYRGYLTFLASAEMAAPPGATLRFDSRSMSAGGDRLFGDNAYDVTAEDGVAVEFIQDEAPGDFLVQVGGSGSFTVQTAGVDRRIDIAVADLQDVTELSLLTQEGAAWACVEARTLLSVRPIYGAAVEWVVDGQDLGLGTCLKTPPGGTEGAVRVDVEITLPDSADLLSLSTSVYVDPTDLQLE